MDELIEELNNIETDKNFHKAMEVANVMYDCLKQYIDQEEDSMRQYLMQVPLIAFDQLKEETGWVKP